MMPIISPRPLGSNSLPYPGMPKPSPREPPQSLVMPPAPAAAPTLVAPNTTPVISRLYSSLLPLREVPNRDLGPMQVHVPFPLQDLRQIKFDLGSFTEDPDNYIRVFQGLTQSFEVAWKDAMPILTSTLTANERSRVIKNAQEWGDEWYATSLQGISDSESSRLPTRLQAVPIADPNWARGKVSDDWKRVHFITCFKEGLKKSWAKPLNYSKLSGMTQ